MFFYNELSEDVQQVYTSWLEANKLTTSDKQATDRSSWSVDVSDDGSTIVVGAFYEDPDNLSSAGSAYVFTKTGDTWTEQKITASDKADTDWFGWSVAVSGDGSTIVVGSMYEDPDDISMAGSAYVFTKTGSTWVEAQKIAASDKVGGGQFGSSVSVSDDGSTIVVGARGTAASGFTSAGSAYVFTKTGSTWTEVQKITASDPGTGADFGNSVSVSDGGSTIVVGAPQAATSGFTSAGSAYVFTKTGSTWTEVQKITASDKQANDRFGQSIAVSGDGSVIVAGAWLEDAGGLIDAGSAYVFTKTGDAWTEAQKLTASDKLRDDRFGISISVSSNGSTIVVGAYWEDPDNLSRAGSAYVFTKSGDTWTEVQKITASDKASGDSFGYSVAITGDGSVIVVGAYGEDPDGVSDAGSAYVFQGQ